MRRLLLFFWIELFFLFQGVLTSDVLQKTLQLPEIGHYYIPQEIACHLFTILIKNIQGSQSKEECGKKLHDFRAALDLRSISKNWNQSLFHCDRMNPIYLFLNRLEKK